MKPPILRLPPFFYEEVQPADFPQAVLRYRNDRAAEEAGLAGLGEEEWIRHFGRLAPLEGNLETPLALAYHGHQFRVYNPEIGDGRGFLLAQVRGADGRLLDLGTKGSGRTPFSRTGDGRLTLKGAVREILATELLQALGVPTSRTFSVIETGERLIRQDEPSPARSAVLVRQSHGHIRIGSFQRAAFFKDEEAMRALVAYVAEELLPDEGIEGPAGLLAATGRRVAEATARLMAAGFVHGVLNTDNINVTGEVFDYGPWRFLPTLDPSFTAAYFDHSGLYAYGRQGEAVYWNLAAFADALALIEEAPKLHEVLSEFPEHYASAFARAVLRRLGATSEGGEADRKLTDDLFASLARTQKPFEDTLFSLHAAHIDGFIAKEEGGLDPDSLAAFEALRARLRGAAAKPSYAPGPETLLIDEVEAIWHSIAGEDDWSPLEEKLGRIRAYGDWLGLPDRL